MKAFIILSILLAMPACVFAETVTAKINGMVCAFCAQGIEKKFKSEESVKDVKVDLDSKLVTIEVKEGAKLSEDKLRKIIVGAGYKVEKIESLKTPQIAESDAN